MHPKLIECVGWGKRSAPQHARPLGPPPRCWAARKTLTLYVLLGGAEYCAEDNVQDQRRDRDRDADFQTENAGTVHRHDNNHHQHLGADGEYDTLADVVPLR